MRITLRDNQTGKNVDVEASGASFGRDAARCHVVIADKSVSNLHAKIFAKDGRWYIEDQGSSNGTYVGGKRSSGPIEIKAGDDIAFFRYGYKVLGGEEGGESTALFVKDAAAPAAAPFGDPDGRGPAAPREPTRRRTPQLDDDAGDDAAASGRNAALLATFKRGLAFYVGAVPKLGLKPMPTVRDGVEQQAFGPMEKLELAAFAAPALIFGALVSAVCGALAGMLHGSIVGSLLTMVVSALAFSAIGVVVAVVVGFIFHPVLGWLVNLLKGHSDATSRTNYAVASFAAGALVQVLSGVGVVVAALPVPFLNLVPLLLGLYGSLVALFVSYLWLQHFVVMRWVPIVVLALMVLAGLGTVSSLVSVTRYDLAMLRGGTTVADGMAAPTGDGGLTTLPAGAAGEIAQGAARPSLIERIKGFFGKGSGAGAPAATAGTAAVVEAQPAVAPTAPGPGAGTTEGTAAAGTAPVVAEGGRTPYAEYQRKLEAVEKAVAADPTLLARAAGVKPLYRKLHEELAHFKKGKGKAGEPYEDRLRQAEVYEATVTVVDELYTKAIEKPVFAASVPAPEGKPKKKSGKKNSTSKPKGGGAH